MPSASFTSSRSYVRRSRRKGANRIPLPSRTTSGMSLQFFFYVLWLIGTSKFYGLVPITRTPFQHISTYYILRTLQTTLKYQNNPFKKYPNTSKTYVIIQQTQIGKVVWHKRFVILPFMDEMSLLKPKTIQSKTHINTQFIPTVSNTVLIKSIPLLTFTIKKK